MNSSCKVLTLWALLGLFGASNLWGQAQRLWDGPALEQSPWQDSLSYLEKQKPQQSLYGFFQALNYPLLSSRLSRKKNLAPHLSYRWQSSKWQSHFYLSLDSCSAEDKVWLIEGKDSLRLNSKEELIFTPALSKDGQLLLIDEAPFGNSQVMVKGQIIAPSHKNNQALRDFGDSGPCQVNANCRPEDRYPALKRASLRYLWVNGGLAGWCSASLVNNTAYDFKPYVLTAEHCALANNFASNSDFRRWVFYFNYLAPTCSEPSRESEISYSTLVGCNWRARSEDQGGDFGSDFLLLELLRPVPAQLEPYFAGWSRLSEAPINGVSYHHPAGDIMKVSTYRERATSASFAGNVPDTHYQVRWDPTPNGHGTSEPGSSGAALLDDQALIRGVLTGGASSCNNRVAPDFYGRFDYSWDRNGELASQRLAPWLDPLGLGVIQLGGAELDAPSPFGPRPEWSVAPNPVENRRIVLRGVSDFSQELAAELYQLDGALMAQKVLPPIPGQDFSLDLASTLAPGLYFLVISQGEQQKHFRLWIR